MPAVSVVIPTYNRAAVIGRALDSVLAQRFEDFDVVVVDDASTDETESVVRSFTDPRIRYVRHDNNRGGSAARNTGIEASESEYIAFLDSDDEWTPSKLEQQVGWLEPRSADWSAVYCEYRIVRHGTTSRLRRVLDDLVPGQPAASKPKGGVELVPLVLTANLALGGASTLLVRRTAVEEIGGFDERFQRHQDWEFLIRLLHNGKLGYVDDTLVAKHQGSFPSFENVQASKEQLFERFADDIRAAERNGYDVIGAHRSELATYAYLNGEFGTGTRYFLKAGINPRVMVWAASMYLSARIARQWRSLKSFRTDPDERM